MLSRNFYHSKRINTFPDIEIKDYKLEEYKNKLQELLGFLVYRFMVDEVSGGYPIPKPLLMQSWN